MNARLLIVDDEAEIRDMLSRHFRYLGFQVDTACDGIEAMEKLAEARTEVIISDIVMPRMNGVELLRAVRQQYPMIHTIMITGYMTLENALGCMRHGADTCVFKPLEDRIGRGRGVCCWPAQALAEQTQNAAGNESCSLRRTKWKITQLLT